MGTELTGQFSLLFLRMFLQSEKRENSVKWETILRFCSAKVDSTRFWSWERRVKWWLRRRKWRECCRWRSRALRGSVSFCGIRGQIASRGNPSPSAMPQKKESLTWLQTSLLTLLGLGEILEALYLIFYVYLNEGLSVNFASFVSWSSQLNILTCQFQMTPQCLFCSVCFDSWLLYFYFYLNSQN